MRVSDQVAGEDCERIPVVKQDFPKETGFAVLLISTKISLTWPEMSPRSLLKSSRITGICERAGSMPAGGLAANFISALSRCCPSMAVATIRLVSQRMLPTGAACAWIDPYAVNLFDRQATILLHRGVAAITVEDASLRRLVRQ